MARVLLIQPPLTADELFARGSESSASIIPPLGLGYIASYLVKHGHECRIIDGIAEPLEIGKLCEISKEYDVVGVTAVSTYTLRSIEVIQALKNSGVKAPVIAGGPHVAAMPESLLRVGADYCVVGEGEFTALELVEKLAAGAGLDELREVRGMAFLDDGDYFFTGRRDRIEPLDQVPLPARDLLPMHKYRSSVARASAQPSHSMLASRGCPGVCSFCNKRTFGTKVRYFSPERIVEEFFLLRDKYGANDIALWDDNFVSNHDIVTRVCSELRKKDFKRTWSVEARVDCVTREVLDEMKSAGCTYIALGIESGSQRLLDHMNKRTDKDTMRRAVQQCKDAGIAVRGYFMMGFPTETVEEMKATIEFAIELDIEVASFTLFVPLPGTLEYRRATQSGTFDPDYYKKKLVPEFNFLDEPVYVPEGMTADELLDIHRSAYQKYYFRPKIIARKLVSAMKSPGELVGLLNGGLTLVRDAFTRK